MQSVAFLRQVFTQVKEKTVPDKAKNLENEQLSVQIHETLKQIECVESRFDWETDSDMIDSLIYEHRSLLSRYRHLITLAKQTNLCIAPKIS